MTRHLAIAAIALAAGATGAHGDSLKARVMVLPAQGTGADARLPGDLAAAITSGARRVTPNVARSTASLADTSVIVGCDPAERACLEAVAAALNVDQMVLVNVTSEAGGDDTVEVTVVSRDTSPVTQRFAVRAATRKEDLAAIEEAVPGMLDAEARAAGGGAGDAGGPREGDRGAGGGASAGDGAGDAPGGGAADAGGRARSTRAPMVTMIAGGAVAVVGLGAWGLAAVKQGDIDDAPTSTAADLERLVELERSARTYATAGNVLVIAGALTATAGVVWYWKTGKARDVTVAPAVNASGGGVVLGGRW